MLSKFFSFLDFATIMKSICLSICILITSIFYLDAFLPSPRRHLKYGNPSRVSIREGSPVFQLNSSSNNDESEEGKELKNDDIVWKLRPLPEVSRLKRLWLRFAANTIRLDCMLKREEPPFVLCPKGGQAVLEAHYRPSNSFRYKKIARFGFTTERGPSNPPIQETVQDVYGLNPNVMVGVGAIIYMFVEPEYRKKNVGTLALQVISLIHAIQSCDFTVLVVDDNGSGKLVEWYEANGYVKAPKLQAALGSPGGIHGVTMIAPTQRVVPDDCFIKWW